MKKLFITAAIATMFAATAFADGTKKSEGSTTVSYTVMNKFSTDFADAKNVTWSVDHNYQKADFVINGFKMTAFYNFSGEFVAVTQDLDAKAIPAKAQKEITEKYNGYVVNEVIVLQNNTALNPDADETDYFIDLKSDTKEVLVRITPDAHLEFVKNIK